MRFLYAVLCVLLVAWGVFGQETPKYTVENKVFTVKSLVAPAAPASGVQVKAPFPPAATTPGTTVRSVAQPSRGFLPRRAGFTTTPTVAFPGGITTNLPVGCVGYV